jgi:Rrf2 family protein
MLRIAKFYDAEKSLTIPELSKAEGITVHNTAKLLRLLRLGGFLESERGQAGGYSLSKPPEQIIVAAVLNSLGGRLFDEDEFCGTHGDGIMLCTNSIECSLRSLWKKVQTCVDEVLDNTTLRDMMGSGTDLYTKVNALTQA